MDVLSQVMYGNSLQAWLIALGVTVAAALVMQVGKRALVKRISALAARTETDVDDLVADLIGRTKFVFILILAAYFGSLVLTLPEGGSSLAGTVATITVIVQFAFWGSGLITFWINRKIKESMEEEDGATATSMNVLGYVANVVLWSVVVILILDNIPGIEVNSLIASLGIGGVAVALAVQNILGDLFASLSIVLDQPFVIGDAIEVGDQVGTVERIGLHTTRVRSLSGEELVYSNSDLVNSRIKNYKSLTRRRVQFWLGVRGDTPYEKLAAIPGILQEIVEAQEKVSFGRAHFRDLGDSALNFDVVYHVDDPDFNLSLDIRQAINLEITRRFEAEGIVFAFPTQTVVLEK